MRDGSWPDTAVRTSTARVILGGVARDVEQVSLTSQLSGGLPVVGGGAVAVTDGSVSWPQAELVTSRVPQPFVRDAAGGPPVVGTPANVEVGDGAGQWWRQVTARIDSSQGSLEGPGVSSKVVDMIDRFSVIIDRDPLLAGMPPLQPDGEYRRVGLVGTYVTDLAARACGFFATPRRGSRTLLSVPCMGSLWPETGRCVAAAQWGAPSSGPLWEPTPWGVGVRRPDAEWAFGERSSVDVTVCLTEQPAGGEVTVQVCDAAGIGAYLSHNSDDTVTAGLLAPAVTPLVTAPRGGAWLAQLSALQDGDSWQVRLRVGTQDQTATSTALPGGVLLSRALMAGSGVIGGLLVEEHGTSTALRHIPSAVFRVQDTQRLDVMPAIRSTPALSLLSDQAQAEGATMWLDSLGRFRWVARGLLELAPVVAEKTTELNVDNFSWSDNLESVREEVVLRYREPALSRSNNYSILLYRDAQAETLTSGQVLEQWLDPGSDEDWIMADLALARMSEVARGAFALSIGSWFGATIVADIDADDNQWWAVADQVFASIQKVGHVYKLTQSALNVAAGRVAVTKVPDDVTNVPVWLRKLPLPLFRGKARVDWADQTTSYVTGATAAVASYEHDCSWFVQDQGRRDQLAAWLAEAMSKPRPTVAGVDIDPDPRLELGDKITIRDPARTGLEFDLVITGIVQSWGGDGSPSMTLEGTITRMEQPHPVEDPASPWARLLAGWTEEVAT